MPLNKRKLFVWLLNYYVFSGFYFYSQTRSSVPVANKLMNSLIENDFVCLINNPFIK